MLSNYQFAVLVAQMREAQKTYFARRTRSALQSAVTLEKRVDEYLLTYLNTYDAEQLPLLGDAQGEGRGR